MISKAGSFAAPTSTGTHAVTGLGFEPKLVIFRWTGLTAHGYTAAQNQVGLGVAISSSSRWSVVGVENTGTASTGNTRYSATDCIATLSALGGTLNGRADLVSMDSDGFTIDVLTAFAAASLIEYLALEGDELEVACGNFQPANDASAHAITGLGFEPTGLVLAASYLIGGASPPSIGTSGMSPTFGLVDSAGDKWGLATQLRNAGASTSASQFLTEDQPGPLYGTSADTVSHKLDVNSLDSDGFTYQNDVLGGTSSNRGWYFWLAVGGEQVGTKLSKFAQPTSTGTDAVTGVGGQPKAMLALAGQYKTAYDSSPSTTDNVGLAMGAADESGNEASTWNHATDAANNEDYGQHGEFLRISNASQVTLAAATVDSLDSDGFTLDWTTADATARLLGILSIFEANPSTSGADTFFFDEYTVAWGIEDSGVDTITITESATEGVPIEDSGEDSFTISDSGLGGPSDRATDSFTISSSGTPSLGASGTERITITSSAVLARIVASGVETITITDREKTARPVLELDSGPTPDAISDEVGFRTATFTWEALENYVEYVVAVVPEEHSRYDEGVAIGSAFGSTNVAGSGSFTPGSVTTTIDGRDLKAAAVHDGLKVIKAFARSSFDEWST